MTRSLRTRIALAALAATAAALVAVLLLVGPVLRRRALDQTRDARLAEARLMARVVEEPLARGADSDVLDRLVDTAAHDVRARVTIIAPDGRVLADSALSGAALAAVDNHANRPEVREALRTNEGASVRHSTTVEDELLYEAVAIRHEGRVVGIARVAVPLTGIEEQVAALRRAVTAAAALAFVITAVLSAALAAPLAGPIAEIMAAARQFAAGNLQARIRVDRQDELGELARILNQSAARLEEQLAETARDRARTEAILAAMEDGVLAVDHRGSVLLANSALRRSLKLADPVGRHYVEALRQAEVGEVIEGVLRSGERRAVEVEMRHVQGFFALTGVPFPGGGDAPHGAVLTFHDVTERRRLDRVRRDFVANASHELRTPLTSIRGFVEALEDGALAEPPTARRFLGKIRTHADRMALLVQDLLDLSRLESGERPAKLEPTAPAAVFREVVEAFAEAAARKRIALRHEAAWSGTLLTDAERLRRILENLVDNGVKYTPEDGTVSLAMRATSDGGAVIEVRDDGPGIPPEHLPRLFERFYRVDKARSRELGGTGLGLAIVKHLSESIGAKVAVESEAGRGTRFTLTLPPAPPGASASG